MSDITFTGKRSLTDPHHPGIYALFIRASGVAPSWDRAKWTKRTRDQAAEWLLGWRARTTIAQRARHIAVVMKRTEEAVRSFCDLNGAFVRYRSAVRK